MSINKMRGVVLLFTLACGCFPAPSRSAEPATPAATHRKAVLEVPSRLTTDLLDAPIQPDAATGRVKSGVLELRGLIDGTMREQFDTAIADHNITTVRITSQGGDIIQALHIAAVIEAHGIDVVVHDLCTGACAQYIFIAGHKRRLDKRALVGFMNTIRSTATLIGMATDTLDVANPMAPLAASYGPLEDDLYDSREVKAALLLDPEVALQPQCVELRRTSTAMYSHMSTTYILWVPTRAYLKAAGVEFTGDWPTSQPNLESLANRYLKNRQVKFVRYGNDDALRPAYAKPYSLEQVRKCVLDALPGTAGGADPG